ncbi:MAG: PaaI family thioesterase [Clostridia bacterium]|nr:PaaI family thioesterase [Clostridia bacterium]
MTDLERARAFFAKDRYATEVTGIVIEAVGPQYAKCSLQLTDRHRNAVGVVMGGVYYTLADFVFGVSTNFDQPAPTVTTVGQINYLNAARGEWLIAESRLLKDGRTTCFYEINITDERGNPIALVTMTGAHLSK